MRRGALLAPAFVALTALSLSPALADPLREDAVRLVEAALASDGAWEKLTHLCDRIGPRLSGSPGNAQAVAWSAKRMRLDGLENVRTQPVAVPVWVRGDESAWLVAPRRARLAMLGLGRSAGTPPEGITAEVVVVTDFDAFDALPPESVEGKIVLWNAPFTTYGETVQYRWRGAQVAAAKGAMASLIRSVTPRSLRSPHTGTMREYEEGERRIPGAALSIEDAEMIARLAAAGEPVRVHLTMGAQRHPDRESANVIGEVIGRELPEEIVVIGGHLDSWDVGQGAYDDGVGCVVAMEAARLLVQEELRPRRTVRVVLWANEETSGRGARAYAESDDGDPAKHFAAIEADGGGDPAVGFGVSVLRPDGEDDEVDAERQARVIEVVREVARLLAPVGADSVRAGGGGVDIAPLMRAGVPGLGLRTTMERYWELHHTHADTADKVDPEVLRRQVAAVAVMAYALAEWPGTLD